MSARLNPSNKRKADSNSQRPNEKKIRQEDPPRKSKRELIREAYNAQPQPFKSWMSGKNFAGPDTVILKDVKAKEEEKPKKRQEDPNHWHAARERRAWIRARQAKSMKTVEAPKKSAPISKTVRLDMAARRPVQKEDKAKPKQLVEVDLFAGPKQRGQAKQRQNTAKQAQSIKDNNKYSMDRVFISTRPKGRSTVHLNMSSKVRSQ